MIHLMHTRKCRTTGTRQSAAGKSCGHVSHVGNCPDCQRAQLARWQAQLMSVQSPSRR